jgi:hypothetical protein
MGRSSVANGGQFTLVSVTRRSFGNNNGEGNYTQALTEEEQTAILSLEHRSAQYLSCE